MTMIEPANSDHLIDIQIYNGPTFAMAEVYHVFKLNRNTVSHCKCNPLK